MKRYIRLTCGQNKTRLQGCLPVLFRVKFEERQAAPVMTKMLIFLSIYQAKCLAIVIRCNFFLPFI